MSRDVRPRDAASAGRRWGLLTALAVASAVAITVAVVLPGWLPVLPRAARRGMVDAFLVGTFLLYALLAGVGLIGTPWFGRRLVRERAEFGRVSKRSLGLFLPAASCLASSLCLELGSAAVHAWTHRFPALPTTFPAEDPSTYRILVLGESSALGEPYRPHASVGQIVAWKLGQAMPTRRFEVETLAWLGDSLETQHLKLARITRKPDAVIVYSGHNEFAARFEEDRGYEPAPAVLEGAGRLISISPFVRLVRELISKNRLDAPPSLKDRHQVIDPPVCSPAEAAAILADFSARLEAIVSYCERIGALAILIIPPAAETGYEPSRSTVHPSVGVEDRRRIAEAFLEARNLEDRDPDAAESAYRTILTAHPEFAEARYRLGGRLIAQGRPAEAREAFRLAMDLDGLPIRCPTPFRDAYRRTAEGRDDCILIDGRDELIAAGPTGLLDEHVVEDTHHPNLKGYVALAAAVLRELKTRGIFGEASAAVDAPDVAGCVERFQLDAARIAEACDRTSVHYQRVAGYRYDPTDRLARSRFFAEAARRLREGAAVAEVGLPSFDSEDHRK